MTTFQARPLILGKRRLLMLSPQLESLLSHLLQENAGNVVGILLNERRGICSVNGIDVKMQMHRRSSVQALAASLGCISRHIPKHGRLKGRHNDFTRMEIG